MVKTVSISRTRLLPDPIPAAPYLRRKTAASGTLGYRLMRPEDIHWIQSWSAQLRLPTSGNTRLRGYILTEQSRNVGYLAARPTAFNTGQGREPVMWIVSAFLIPSHRGRGLLPRYCEILSRALYSSGKAAARIAADNDRMHRFVNKGGWRKVRTTRRYTDYVLELASPFRAFRRE